MTMTPIILSNNYLLEVERTRYIEGLHTEHLSFLAILYGEQIESGAMHIKGYGHLTMTDIESELHIRTLMYRARRLRKSRELKEEYDENERALLEELKNIA